MFTYGPTDDIPILFGGDSLFEDAYMTFYCLDNYMAEIQRLVRRYTNYRWLAYRFSTIDDYLSQISETYKESDLKIPVVNSDFIPFDNRIKKDNSHNKYIKSDYTEYWTGFYSTNPVIKQQIADLNHKIRALSSLHAINHLEFMQSGLMQDQFEAISKNITEVKQNTARMLDHTVITGAHHADVYKQDLNKSITDTNLAMDQLMTTLYLNTLKLESTKQEGSSGDKLENETISYFVGGEITGDLYPVTLHNPSIYERTEVINITIQGAQAAIFDENLDPIESQLMECYTLDMNQGTADLE